MLRCGVGRYHLASRARAQAGEGGRVGGCEGVQVTLSLGLHRQTGVGVVLLEPATGTRVLG